MLSLQRCLSPLKHLLSSVDRVKRFNKALIKDKVFGLSVCSELGHKTKLPKTDEQR